MGSDRITEVPKLADLTYAPLWFTQTLPLKVNPQKSVSVNYQQCPVISRKCQFLFVFIHPAVDLWSATFMHKKTIILHVVRCVCIYI